MSDKPLTKIKNLYGFPSLKKLAETFGIPFGTARNLDGGAPSRNIHAILRKIIKKSEQLTPERREEIRNSLKPAESSFYLNNLLDFLMEIKP
jgi:hypothetical protein